MDIPASALLVIFTITDMKTGTIWRPAAVLGIAAGLLLRAALPEYQIADGLYGILCGGMVFLLSWLSKEAIGRGDCYMLCVLGAAYGCVGMLDLFFIALTAAACWAVFLLVRKKADRKTGFPLMPFLLLSWILTKTIAVGNVLTR